MFEIVSAIFQHAGDLHVKGLQLRVDPFHNALTLSGHAAFSSYAEMASGVDRFRGGESAQIKKKLEGMSGKGVVVEVTLEPSMSARTLGAYHFHITRTFKSGAEVESEVERLKNGGFIDARYYPVHAPDEEHAHKVFKL